MVGSFGGERGTASRRVHQTELLRIWTALLSYMLAKANLAYEKTQATSFRDRSPC